MTFQRENVPTIPPFAEESWANQTGDTFIEDIAVLGVRDAMTYVGQRQIRDFYPGEEPANAGSEGFDKCSGLVIRDRTTGVHTFSHLEPFADAWHTLMQTGQRHPVRWSSPRDAVLVYGSVSSRQYELERLMAEEFWGPATLRIIEAETGDTHWGMVLYRSLGQLAVVRKKPDHTVFRYQLFEPTGN